MGGAFQGHQGCPTTPIYIRWAIFSQNIFTISQLSFFFLNNSFCGFLFFPPPAKGPSLTVSVASRYRTGTQMWELSRAVHLHAALDCKRPFKNPNPHYSQLPTILRVEMTWTAQWSRCGPYEFSQSHVCVCVYVLYVCVYGGTYVFNMVACGTGGLMSEPRAPNPLPCKHTSVVLDSERSSCWVEHRTNSSHEIVKGVSCHGLGHTFHVRRGSQMWISELTAVYESAQGADQVDCLLYQVLYREFATLKF